LAEVLICGAGPTGLTLAIELARRNVDVRIIDKETTPPDNARALVMKPCSLIAAERMGFLDRLLEEGVAVDTMSYSFEGRIIATATSSSVRWPWNHNVGEDRVVPLLTDILQSFGVLVERGIELKSFEQREEAIDVSLENRLGETEAASVGWLIGCDGVHSPMRDGAGIAFEGHERTLNWHVLDADIDGWPYKDSTGMLFFESLLVGVYRTRDVYRIYSASFERNKESWSRVRDFLRQHVPSAELGPPLSDTEFHSVSKISENFRKGRILLAGDAAHAMSPSGGLGLNCGIQDALNLGWKLASVIRGHANDALLDTYSSERRTAAEGCQTVSQRNDDLFSITDPSERSRAFRRFVVGFTQYMANGGNGWEPVMGPYESSLVVQEAAPEFGPRPGEFLPAEIRLATAEGRPCWLTGAIAGTDHTLLVFTADGGVEAEQLVRQAIDLCRGSSGAISLCVVARSIEGATARTALADENTELLVDTDLHAHNVLGVIERCAMWIRPDGWIGAREDDLVDISGIESVFKTAFSGLFEQN